VAVCRSAEENSGEIRWQASRIGPRTVTAIGTHAGRKRRKRASPRTGGLPRHAYDPPRVPMASAGRSAAQAPRAACPATGTIRCHRRIRRSARAATAASSAPRHCPLTLCCPARVATRSTNNT
jgi:hypothetical protein